MVAAWVAIAVLLGGGLTGLAVVDGQADGSSREVALPDTPAGRQLKWVLGALVEAPTEEEIMGHFNAKFVEAVPPAQLLTGFAQMRADGPYTVSSIEKSSDYALVVVVDGRASQLRTSIAIEPEPPHLISGLFFAPAARPEPVTSWEALDERLRRAAPEVGFLAAEIVDGKCRPVHAIDLDAPLSLGSAFKLYVLGAAADTVRAARLSWTTPVEIREDARVHTSARTEPVPTGQTRPLEELARHMIEVSDNTATDLVLGAVGRERVEAVQAEMGMAEPARNVPFLSTREMSLIKFGRPRLVDEYLSLRPEGRRAFLDDRLAGRPANIGDLDLAPRPVAVDTVEWFGSAHDLCRAHVTLQSKGPEVRRILGHNPGIPFGRDAVYVAFKGGSEPGVLAGSWYVEHRDGRRFAISVLLRNREGAIETSAISVAADAFHLASA